MAYPDERHTTVVQTDGSSSGALVAIVLLVLAAIVAFFLFGDGWFGSGDLNVDVNLPAVEAPAAPAAAPSK